MRVNGKREVFLVVDTLSDDGHDRRFEIQVWRLTKWAGFRRVARKRLVMDWIPTESKLSDWLRISHPAVIACEQVEDSFATCTEFLDAVFVFDASRGNVSTLFYPAGAGRSFDGKGHGAFFSKGGYRVFVVNLREVADEGEILEGGESNSVVN